uniref:Uncharacterized protein n=1 Tax=Panagrolaimus superbus TaxID=310955 RepID=A0A914YCU4_9BILA
MEQIIYADTSAQPQPTQTQSTTASSTTNNSETPQTETSMTKLTEVFMTAALAFQRLGELTQHIHVVGETKWTESDATKLTNALEKFQEECSEVTKSLQTRTGKMIRNDFKRRTVHQYHAQQGNAMQQSAAAAAAAASGTASSSYATVSPSHYNGASPSTSQPIQGYSYQAQRMIPTYPVHQKVGLPTTSYSVGQKRPAQPLSGIPVKRIVGGTTFRPVSTTSLISQPTSSNVYRK